MIRICERCYGHVQENEAHVSLGHLDRVLPDGTIVWIHSYVHTTMCPPAGRGRSPIDRPDTGDWDVRRRGLSPAAAAWTARRAQAAEPARQA